MSNPKLLAVFPSYHSAGYGSPIGGGEISNRLLLEGLADRGWDVIVVTANSDIVGEANGVKVKRVMKSKNSFMSVFFRQFFLKRESCRIAKRFNPDVVVCGPTALRIAREVSARFGVRCGLIVRAFENFEFLSESSSPHLSLKLRVVKMLLGNYQAVDNQPDFCVFNSQYMRDIIEPHIKGRGYVVYPSVDVDVKSRLLTEIKRVHMVGLSYEKGFKILKGLADYFPNINFSVYGKKSGQIFEDGLPVNVIYKGWASLNEIYGGCDVFIVPSQIEEAFGRVAIEALSFGCIVLVSDKGGLPETVDYDPELILDNGDIGGWCAAISSVSSDIESYSYRARLAAKKITRFGIDCQLVEFEKALLNEIALGMTIRCEGGSTR